MKLSRDEQALNEFDRQLHSLIEDARAYAFPKGRRANPEWGRVLSLLAEARIRARSEMPERVQNHIREIEK